jgi:hypothetical protein
MGGGGGRKLRATLAFMCGLWREGMPRDVFRIVMDLLMPSLDPLRRKNAGAVSRFFEVSDFARQRWLGVLGQKSLPSTH